MKRYARDTILFDLDGTLINSVPFIVMQLKWFYQKYGRVIKTVDQIKQMLGPPEERILASQFGEMMAATYVAQYSEFLRIQSASLGVPNVRDFFGELHRRGIAIGVVTNKSTFLAEQTLDALDIGEFIDNLVAGDMGIPIKPAPDGIIHAMKNLDADAATTLMVGDTLSDKGATVASGVAFVHGLWFSTEALCVECEYDCDDFIEFENNLLQRTAKGK